MGYHNREIKKGILGDFSKIFEEFDELLDANEQGDKVLEICEICDLLGAIELYTVSHYNLTLEDLKKFSDKTKSAFKDGTRK